MQTLFLIRNNEVTLQKEDFLYFDTLENFELDAENLPDNIQEIDYVPEFKQCSINGEAFQDYPNLWADNIIANISTIIANKEKRLAPPEPTFEEYVKNKHNQLYSTMSSKRNSLTVAYDNDKFDANETAQNNMNALLKSFELGTETVNIRSTNEITHTFAKEQCNELALLMIQTVNSLYEKYWQLKDALYKCSTKEEVDTIIWE